MSDTHNIPTKICKNCGAQFQSYNPRKLCCTDSCSKHGGRKPHPFIDVKCVVCGKVAKRRARVGGGRVPKTCGNKTCIATHKRSAKEVANARWRKANPNYVSPNDHINKMKNWVSTKHHGYPLQDVSLWADRAMAFKVHPCAICGELTRTKYCSKRCMWRGANKGRKASIRQRISRSISTRISSYIKGKDVNATKFCTKHLGYTWDALKQHIESTFRPHMTWDNYGSEWHIDHIVPMALHDFSKDKASAIKVAYALDNLMARWATTEIAQGYGDDQIGNINKGDRLCA